MCLKCILKHADSCAHGGIYSVDHRLVKVDCSSNVNPLGIPRAAIEAIKKNVGRISPVYPDSECKDLKAALSRFLSVSTNQLAVGNGAVEIIYWFCQLYAKKRVVIPVPTFCEYEIAARRAGAKTTFVALKDSFRLDPNLLIEKSRGADAIFLCNPNNPTGMLSTEDVKKIIKNLDSSTKILLDECFIELVDKPEANTMIEKIGEFENLVILRSLTKSFGMAGLRVGYSVSSPIIAAKFSEAKIPWNVNGLAQVAAVAALSDAAHVDRARKIIKKERQHLYSRIKNLENFVPIESDANYFLVKLKKADSTGFRDLMLKKTGVLVRDCSTFTGMDSSYIRVAVRTRKENMLLLKALEEMDNA